MVSPFWYSAPRYTVEFALSGDENHANGCAIPRRCERPMYRATSRGVAIASMRASSSLSGAMPRLSTRVVSMYAR